MADNVTANGVPVATDEVTYSGESDKHVQLMRLVGVTGSEDAKTVTTAPFELAALASYQAGTATGAGNGTVIDVSTVGKKHFGLRVKGTGAAADAWNVVLEGSFDGTNFGTILQHINTDATTPDGGFIWTSTAQVALYFRYRVVSVTLGSATNIQIQIVGMN